MRTRPARNSHARCLRMLTPFYAHLHVRLSHPPRSPAVLYPPCTMLKVMEASERIATAPAAAPAAAPTARARAKTIDASRYEWKDVSEEGKKFRVISVLPTFL